MAAVYLVKLLSDGISMDFSADKSTMVEVNAWANADTVVYSHIASLGHNELIITVNKLSCRQQVSDCTSHGPVHRCLVTDPLSNFFIQTSQSLSHDGIIWISIIMINVRIMCRLKWECAATGSKSYPTCRNWYIIYVIAILWPWPLTQQL